MMLGDVGTMIKTLSDISEHSAVYGGGTYSDEHRQSVNQVKQQRPEYVNKHYETTTTCMVRDRDN